MRARVRTTLMRRRRRKALLARPPPPPSSLWAPPPSPRPARGAQQPGVRMCPLGLGERARGPKQRLGVLVMIWGGGWFAFCWCGRGTQEALVKREKKAMASEERGRASERAHACVIDAGESRRSGRVGKKRRRERRGQRQQGSQQGGKRAPLSHRAPTNRAAPPIPHTRSARSRRPSHRSRKAQAGAVHHQEETREKRRPKHSLGGEEECHPQLSLRPRATHTHSTPPNRRLIDQ